MFCGCSAYGISAGSYEIESDLRASMDWLRTSLRKLVQPPLVRAELVEAWGCSLIWWHACAKGGCRDVRPAAHLLLAQPAARVVLRRQGALRARGSRVETLQPQKKAKEGDPTVCVPALRFGQPAVLASSGVSLKLAALKQSRALIRWPLRSSAHTEGMDAEQPNSHAGHRCARPGAQATAVFRGRAPWWRRFLCAGLPQRHPPPPLGARSRCAAARLRCGRCIRASRWPSLS